MRAARIKALLPFAAILFLFCLNLWVLSSTHRAWNIESRIHFQLEHHLGSIKNDLTTGYLWLEHALRQNGEIDYEKKVAAYLARTIENNTAFINSLRTDPRLREQYPEFLGTFQDLQKELLAFYAMAHDFWINKKACPEGGLIDKKFEKLLAMLAMLDLGSNSEHATVSTELDNAFITSLFILLGANILMLILLYLFNRSKESYAEAFKEQKDALSTLFERSYDGVLILEGNTIRDYNSSMAIMLGQPHKKELIKAKVSEFSPEFQPDGSSSSKKFADMIESGLIKGYERFEWQFGKSNGETFYAEVLITPLSIENKQLLYVVCQDISRRKALEESLKQKNTLYKNLVNELDATVKERTGHMLQQSRLAQMGEMISMIAHQWRQPLASISAISGTLTMDVMMDEYKKEFFRDRLEAITNLSVHLSATIDDFRSFFKEAKSKERTSWKELAEASLAIIGPTLTTKAITVHTHFNETGTLNTYTNEVRQVILNILKNAEDILMEKAVKEGEIWIRSYIKGTHSYLCIEDNGGGIPDSIITKIFDPYFSTKEKKDGTGLGLYMSKTIIEEHCGGHLDVRNTANGALFEIRLPVAEGEKR